MAGRRLDRIVSELTGASRARARSLIMAGRVFVEGARADKAGTEIPDGKKVEVKDSFPYVSRGALKIKEAAEKFGIDFSQKIICDIGASTGGFTDYALQRGARKVYAIDVGYGQLAQKIREDRRVVVMERTNIKEVESLPEAVDIFLIDVSFISLKKVLPQVKKIIESSGSGSGGTDIVALIKPQFEVGKETADRCRGVIKDKEVHREVVSGIKEYIRGLGLRPVGVVESPVKGAKGNTEFLIYLKDE